MVWKATGVAFASLEAERMREVFIDRTGVLVVWNSDTPLATASRCPHQAGVLADGTFEEGRLTCPDHGAVFDVVNGHVLVDPFGTAPPAGGCPPLRCYPVRLEAGLVWVDLD